MQRYPPPDVDELAGVLGHRTEAMIIDVVLIAAAVGVVGFLAGLVLGATLGAGLGGAVTFALLGTPIVLPFYHAGFEGYAGQTIGKRLMGIVVVRTDGSRCTWKASIVRNLLRVVDFLPGLYAVGIASTFLTDREQRLGDLAAGTIVVQVAR